MFDHIKDKIQRDSDYPQRQFEIDVLTRVITGKLYKELPYPFTQEREGGNTGEYIQLRDRRPSVRYALCKVVVDDSVSLLFSEGHFPAIECADEKTRDTLTAIVKESKLNAVMLEAATVGSVGSVAILMKVLSNRLFFSVKNSQFLTPVWKPDEPDTLLKVIERYKVKGNVLQGMGYTIADDDLHLDFWFHCEWDDTAETWMIPQRVKKTGEDDVKPAPDPAKTVKHNLGFVPVVWVKNLPGGDAIDGACTFPPEAIDTQIEIDYQLSQAGRGLKYSSDPTLLIKEPAFGNSGSMVKGGGNAIVVDAEGDAKMLEINGTASAAVLEYVRALREFALESAHGNRANADKLSAAQSGRSMELMNQALIWLADKLRISYGEGALLSLLRMIVAATEKLDIKVNRKAVGELSQSDDLTLRWPHWYAPTYADKQAEATTLGTLRDKALISQETAVKALSPGYDIADPADELATIKAEPPPPGTEVKPGNPSPEAND